MEKQILRKKHLILRRIKTMKRLITIIMTLALLMLCVTACNGESEGGGSGTTAGGGATQGENNNNNDDDNNDDEISGDISVVTREEESGTRGAFVELFDVRYEDEDGKKHDDVRIDANVQNSTGQVIEAVVGNKQAISYVSLGSLDNTVKALKINGVEATAANVLSGDYEVFRPFNIVTREGDVSDATQEFINFILSEEGQAFVSEGFISEGDKGAYKMGDATGTVKVEGSSSIGPLMTKLAEEFMKVNDKVEVKININDSGTGVSQTVAGNADIGMVSRNVRDEEIEQGLKNTVIALDGIAVIVNTANPLSDATIEQIRAIFKDDGDITTWEQMFA
jgi:phosphate transport system substrate-binding protein